MTVQDYLGQARWLDQRINSEIAESARLREMIKTVGASSLEAHYNPNRPTEAPFIRGLEKVWEMEEKIDADIDRLVDLKEQIRDVIGALPDVKEQLVLTYRYVHDMAWEQISDKMHVDTSTIRRWHKSALQNVKLPADIIAV